MTTDMSSEDYNQVVEDICTLLSKEALWSSELEQVLQGYKKRGTEKAASKKKQLVFEYSDSETETDSNSESESNFDIQALPLGGLELFKPEAGSYHQEEPSETVLVCSWDSQCSSPREVLDLSSNYP